MKLTSLCTLQSLIAASLFLQGCGNVSVPSKVLPSEPLYTQSKPGGEFCSDVGPSYTTPTKFLFVIDMSLSNLGGELIYQTVADGQGSNNYRHTLGTHVIDAVVSGGTQVSGMFGNFDIGNILKPGETYQQRADRIVASDKAGRRFEAIQKFLSEPSCANIANNFSYSIIGFGNDAMMPLGAPLSCESGFEPDIPTFSSQILGMKKYQDNDLSPQKKVYVGGPQSPYQMGSTNYRKGLLCGASKIEKDAYEAADEFPFYYSIFLSDGLATDKYDPCGYLYETYSGYNQSYEVLLPGKRAELLACSQKYGVEACYTDVANCNSLGDQCIRSYLGNSVKRDWVCLNSVTIPGVVKDLKTKLEGVAAGFKLQPVFYWPTERESLSDFTTAEKVMQPLAEAGGVESLIRLDSGDAILGLAKNICSKIEANLKTQFTITGYLAVNLTSKISQGQLRADSDMDGLDDDTEINATSTDPTLARTDGKVLDGICSQLGGAACSTVPACDSAKFSGLGLNDCDVKLLQTKTAEKVLATDSDGDSILDFIELLKGSQPFAQDATDILFQDSPLTVKAAIGRGYDLENSPELFKIAESDLMQADFRFNKASANCGAGRESLSVSLNNIPLIPVKAFTDLRAGPLNLSHAEDENLVAVIYQVTPIGRKDNQVLNYVHIIRVPLKGAVVDQMTPLNSVLLTEAP